MNAFVGRGVGGSVVERVVFDVGIAPTPPAVRRVTRSFHFARSLLNKELGGKGEFMRFWYCCEGLSCGLHKMGPTNSEGKPGLRAQNPSSALGGRASPDRDRIVIAEGAPLFVFQDRLQAAFVGKNYSSQLWQQSSRRLVALSDR